MTIYQSKHVACLLPYVIRTVVLTYNFSISIPILALRDVFIQNSKDSKFSSPYSHKPEPNVVNADCSSSEQDRQCTYNVQSRRVRATTVAVQTKYVLHILSVCLQTQLYSVQFACAMLSYVACPALQYFPTLSLTKCYDFRKAVLNTKCVF